MKKRTLAEIIEIERQSRCETGDFGINACKESILYYVKMGESLFTLLEKYVERANTDVFFNKRMVLACWEMINEN